MSVPQGLSANLGWFQSVMARVCENLERVRFVDDIIVVSVMERNMSRIWKGYRAHGEVHFEVSAEKDELGCKTGDVFET